MELMDRYDRNVIIGVEEGSIAEELDIKSGDILVSINGEKVQDLMEYYYLSEESELEVEIQHIDGEVILYEIEKEPEENLGILFTNKRMNQVRCCHNRCIFCFIDQLPKGMRSTLYIKDDDSRLSFLQGNFITMTNMTQDDLDKMVKCRISPVNISVHTTNLALRQEMLGNSNAGEILQKIAFLAEAKIQMNVQIVLIPGMNDGLELEKTLMDLAEFFPQIHSVAVVPVGITKYREHLPKLEIFNSITAGKVIEQVENNQKKFLNSLETRFVFLSDEFYVLSGRSIPISEVYEGYTQLENGVGLMRKFKDEIQQELNRIGYITLGNQRNIHLATGSSAYSFMQEISNMVMGKIQGLKITVHGIRNDYFGETITVAGLLTGSDLKQQLAGIPMEDGLILPQVMFRDGEEVFLDDEDKCGLERTLNCKIAIVPVHGQDFISAVIGHGNI